MRSTNSRTPSLRCWDFPLQGYKEPSLRMEGSLQCNQLLTIWYVPGFVRKLIKLWWPCALMSLAFERAVLHILLLLVAAGCCIFWGLVRDWDRYAKLKKSFGWVQRLAISHFTLLKGHSFRYSSPAYPLLADVHVHVEGLSWVRIQWGRKIHPSNLTQTP